MKKTNALPNYQIIKLSNYVVVGKGTEAIERRLKDVQVLSSEETLNILPELNDQTIANDEE